MVKKKIPKNSNVVIYQAKNGAIELRGDFSHETIWATQAQVVSLFGVDQSVVSRHIKNIFKEGEVEEKSNMQKMHNANSDKPIVVYSLDVILGVGYRTNSKIAIEFRKWATKTLREHITKGYTINPKVVKNNYAEFQKAIENIRHLLPAETNIGDENILELISAFADTWLSLDAYDKDLLVVSGATKKSVSITAEQLAEALAGFKTELLKNGEATEIFGQERQVESVAGIVGNVMQSFGGKPMYPTVEEKAAHLLYFMVKNHPFVDGNKRSGAFSFIWFLSKAGILNMAKINSPALTVITLLIAESDPKHKEKMIRLVLQLLKK